ncbi:MAG TPA: 50S ribosomal protein L13 [Candidatus Magasanikbacteria bacterium]|nr:MAG: 50S ribosomal protein L13 [Candidatus Magasanikbacteria bacterium RIFCSPLOWO2_02_FULL_47_16]OGH80067.1 MAG: 50S ribosomal protein L13 [Candidatus Magasanikbacteria bacterium RIFCSPHIGHO2_02_FULL_48_18]OGH82827.1 MAG: 50S ribosomal protein L13 [Candidatus Magasanikbacteria bacterium RIFCSPLOWO2_12_FULL_47_9b]HAZ28451.1 50S ribosomal protein L13 [Candidatus Magasanikbacteria bacterium]
MAQAPLERKNHEIDAAGQSVGRVASRAALLLKGKNKATYAPHIDGGDCVTIVNASQVKFTGRKLVQKDYYHHTMHPGGLKRTPMKNVFDANPANVMKRAIMGMLPKNKHRENMMRRLIVKP